jgi:signal transduction histidine kinase
VIFLGGAGLRKRLTVAATVAGMAGLAIGGAFMATSLDRSLVSAVDDSARSTARDIAVLVDNDRLTNPLPSFGSAVAQVVDTEGRVIVSTPGGDRLSPIVTVDRLEKIADGQVVELHGSRLGQSEPFRVAGVQAGPADDPRIVLVAMSLAQKEDAASIVRRGLFIGAFMLSIALGALSWFLTGRALRPVERLRQGASDISGISGTGQLDRLPLSDANDEIYRLAVTLNGMLGRIEAASMQQRSFVSDAAHELRSPIAAARTQLEVALAHPDAVDAHDAARDALDELERLRRLVDDLLVLARLDEAGRGINAQPVDLVDVVQVVAERMGDARVPIAIPDGGAIAVRGDEQALTRVVRNLLDNAVRHARSSVTVHVSRYAHTAELTVADNGPGVPVEDRRRIFERFARLDNARGRDEGGTGLGLAIVREIVGAHSGTVRVEDALPGARFVIHLPLAPVSKS